ncbi:MAG: hypothetical protein JSU96_18270 [Acidobacteriota bacterium]|nr:MAG: hypothetical protein JSU96_18270 [Acidobacteriota bacterium]
MLQRVILTVLAFSGLAVSGSAAGPIRATDQFESGSLGEFRIEDETRLIMVPRTDRDQDRVNSAVTWFYGRLENVLNRLVTIELEKLDYTVYNGKVGTILPFERNTVPVYSYDGEHWERFSNCRFEKESRRFVIQQIFSRDSVWIAYIPPYTLSRLEELVKRLETHPAVTVDLLGESAEGRPLYLVSLETEPHGSTEKPVVWIQARQHAFESGGSWAVEGLLRFLTSSDPLARKLLERLVFKVCPMLNPDAVVNGGTRFNAKGVDLNRHWNAEDPYSADLQSAPEIGLVKRALQQLKQSRRLDLWINIHNNDMVWNEDGDYINFAPKEREAEARELETLLRDWTIFTGPFELTENGNATESVVAGATGALSLLMEMKTGFLEEQGRWTGVDLFVAYGESLAKVLGRFFRIDAQFQVGSGDRTG